LEVAKGPSCCLEFHLGSAIAMGWGKKMPKMEVKPRSITNPRWVPPK
jgi:hypothetical protein